MNSYVVFTMITRAPKLAKIVCHILKKSYYESQGLIDATWFQGMSCTKYQIILIISGLADYSHFPKLWPLDIHVIINYYRHY